MISNFQVNLWLGLTKLFSLHLCGAGFCLQWNWVQICVGTLAASMEEESLYFWRIGNKPTLEIVWSSTVKKSIYIGKSWQLKKQGSASPFSKWHYMITHTVVAASTFCNTGLCFLPKQSVAVKWCYLNAHQVQSSQILLCCYSPVRF